MTFNILAIVGLIVCVVIIVSRPEPKPPTYDYEQIQFCLIERAFPYSTLADGQRDLRFCIGYDQDVRR